MKLSKNTLLEIIKKCEKRFPQFVGASTDFAVWKKFCAKNPVEFRGESNGVKIILRLTNDSYAITYLNPTGNYRVYTF